MMLTVTRRVPRKRLNLRPWRNFVLSVLCLVWPMHAQAAQRVWDLGQCTSGAGVAPESKIADCTAVLTGGQLLPDERAAIYTNRGLAYGEIGRFDLAIADYTAAIGLVPTYVPAFVDRGIAYRNTRQADRAIADYNQAIALDPSDAYAFSNRATAYTDKKADALAIADFTAALHLQPTNPRTYVNRAVTYDAIGRLDLSESDYSRALVLRPGYGDALNGRCFVRAEQGLLTQALADCNAALALSRNAETLDSRGFVFLKFGQFTQAIHDYDDALRLSPRMPSSLYGRGVAKLRLHIGNGHADISAALSVDPGIAAKMARYAITP